MSKVLGIDDARGEYEPLSKKELREVMGSDYPDDVDEEEEDGFEDDEDEDEDEEDGSEDDDYDEGKKPRGSRPRKG